jgi:hypothetical protein
VRLIRLDTERAQRILRVSPQDHQQATNAVRRIAQILATLRRTAWIRRGGNLATRSIQQIAQTRLRRSSSDSGQQVTCNARGPPGGTPGDQVAIIGRYFGGFLEPPSESDS